MPSPSLPFTTYCSLEAEGLQFFKRDWRYRCFVAIGDVDGIDSLLGTARRQQLARQAEGERHRELAERCAAVGAVWFGSRQLHCVMAMVASTPGPAGTLLHTSSDSLHLAHRLDAAGLEFYHSTSPMFAEWLKTGEGATGWPV